MIFSSQSSAAQKKKAKPRTEERQATAAVVPAPALPSVNDINVGDLFESGEEFLKTGRQDDALKTFQAIYTYSRDVLSLMRCVKGGYDKALAQSEAVDQNTKEELYLKLQRISSLTVRYTELKNESAYRIGLIHRAKGNAEQARKYLLEICQTAPFSLDAKSTWMKSKEALLSLSHLEGEF